MAGRNHANYAAVGFTVVAGIAAIFAALVYFGGFAGGKNEFLAETYYDAPVSGLSVGSDVAFRGVKVGEVKSISFIGADYPEASEADRQNIRVVLAFNTKLVNTRRGATPLETLKHLVKKGVRATVSSSGITGISHIELDYPKVAPPKERVSWASEHTPIPPAPSMLESFADSAAKVMNQLNAMDLAAACSNAAVAAESAMKVVDEVRTLVETERPAVSALISNLESASASLKDFAEEIRAEPSLLLRARER